MTDSIRGDDSGEFDVPAMQGSNQMGMRARNERLVLSLVRRHGALPKANIARMTGLSAQTVSVIMRALEADGLLERGEPIRGKVGQPSIPMRLARDGAFFWGLKVGRRSIELVLTNFLGEVVDRSLETYGYPTPEETVRFAREAIEDISGRLPANVRARIEGLGIAIPFRIWRWAREINVSADAMAAWRNFDIAAALRDICGCPVFLQNDASAACGAELVFGTGARPSDFLYLYIGYFIGGGVVLDGRLYTGPTGNAGAIGPLPVMGPDGKMTPLLEIASLSLLERDLRQSGADSKVLWSVPEDWDVPEEMMTRWAEVAAGGLAQGIVAALSIIDFEAVLIDGWMPEALRAQLIAMTARRLAQANMTGLNMPALRAGAVGPDARALGAASLPLSQRYIVDT